MDIDFYYIEKPQGHNEFMLFAKYDNMPQTCYHNASKSFLEKLKNDLNEKLNVSYIKENSPLLIPKQSTPKKYL